MTETSWVRRIPNILPKLKSPALGTHAQVDSTSQGGEALLPEQETSQNGSWKARITHIPASLAEGVNTGISTASSFLSSSAHSGESRPGTAEDHSWRRRIAGLSAHLALPFQSVNPAASHGIVLSTEVQKALRDGGPVVALESTIISHGMPYPQNLETAQAVEQVVRDGGATPATVAIIEGVPHVGLTPEQLNRIATRGEAVHKTSRRDLPHVVARRLDGATTVSATALLAARAGIAVFVTGGIGGVHRGAEISMDISSDLTEFAKSPVAVVCAGAKSILDIPRTLEYLETQGVTVAAFGTDEFPAFFTPRSGCKAPCRVDSPEEAAQLVRASQLLALGSGILIAIPVPEEFAAEGLEMERAIQRALQEAGDRKLAGPETTPFLLQRIQELTGGASLATNIKLIKNNAAVGAQIALALARQGRQRHESET